MNRTSDRPFIKRRTKHKLPWIIPIYYLYERRFRSSSDFETTDGISFRINLSRAQHFGDNYLFCTLSRKQDCDPAVQFCISWKLSIGPNDYIPSQRDETFSQGICKVFRLPPEKQFANNNCSFKEPEKLILHVDLQRLSPNKLHAKGVSVTTDLELFTLTRHGVYQKILQFIPEQGSRPAGFIDPVTQILKEFFADVDRSFWTPALEPNSNSKHSSQLHLLDSYGGIDISSKIWKCSQRAYEERVLSFLLKIDGEYVPKEPEIYSRDRKIGIRVERARLLSASTSHHISQKWMFSPISRINNNNLHKDMNKYFWSCRKGAFLEIRSNGEALKVNKDLLVARLPVFSTMLSHDMIERQTNVINIDDIDYEVLKHFLNFLYSGTFESRLGLEDLCDLYKIADKYFVKDLCRMCSRHLISIISLENFDDLLVLSDLLGDRDLQSALRFFCYFHVNNVIADNWRHPTLSLFRFLLYGKLRNLRMKCSFA